MDGYQARYLVEVIPGRNAIHVEEVTMAKGQIEDRDPIEFEDGCIYDVDRSLSPIGRFYRHSQMRAGMIPMVFDEFGRGH
jgi:hypothetical protein